MRRSGGQSLSDELLPVIRPQGFQQAREVTGSEIRVHIRDLPLQIRFIALAEATGHKNPIHFPRFFFPNEIQNGIDTFLLGIGYETTSVDHDDIAFSLVHDIFPPGPKLPHEHL